MEQVNVAGQMIDRAQCFTDMLDISTTEIDKVQEKGTELMQEFTDNICEEAINALVPSSLQKASCTLGKLVSGASEWLELLSVGASVDAAFRGVVKCRDAGFTTKVEVKHALSDLGC